jgi:hypothetical protein
VATKGTHVIENLIYAKDYLLCVCGWEGKAWDLSDFGKHKKASLPTDKKMPKERTTFNTRILQETI